MSESKTKKVKTSYPKDSDTVSPRSHFQGSGHIYPHGYTRAEYNALVREWNEKLQKSGHADIEAYSASVSGLVSPFLKNSRPSSTYRPHNDPSEALDFARTYQTTYMHTSQARWLYGKDHAAALFLLDCYIHQVEYRDIARLKTSGDREAFEALYPLVDFPTYFSLSSLKNSHYWAYQRTRKILNNCWLWHITDPNGEISIRALEFYGFLGLDCKGTSKKYNAALKKIGLGPINLKIPEAKY